MPRVLFVSKAIVPPFHDGSKCLVRDVATHLKRTTAVIMTTREDNPEPALARLERAAVYRGRGGFAPSLSDNAGVARHLLFNRSADIWHFVMAPSPRTCRIARFLKAIRRVPVVQTLASQPRSFTDISTLLFGDVIVAQSAWTRDRIIEAASAAKLDVGVEVIPPPLGSVARPSPERIERLRAQLSLPANAKVFLYPGDLEVSQGALIVASLVEPISAQIPDAVFVFACREKTPRAPEIRRDLEARLDPAKVRFVGEVPDFLALLALAEAVLFPVNDLWGKVDLPIALLEALALEVPVLALAEGPLLDLAEGAQLILSEATEPWANAVVQLVRDDEQRRMLTQRGRAFVESRHSASTVAAAYERIYDRLLA